MRLPAGGDTATASATATKINTNTNTNTNTARGTHPADAGSLHCAAGQSVQPVAGDDFQHGLGHWRIEAQDPHTRVEATDGVLRWQTPAGLSLWWREPLPPVYAIRFTAVPMPAPLEAGPALAGRVSDLNMFWQAREPGALAAGEPVMPRVRDGRFSSYHGLQTWYVGFGANSNSSTRLRRYDGQGQRLLVDGWADGPAAEAGDRRGPMVAATRLVAGQPLAVAIVAPAARNGAAHAGHWSVNGQPLFAWPLPAARAADGGWFALRSTASAFEIRGFHILGCR